MYCEDSVADEVEHFRPKDLYPEVVFAWMNYLYACGPCNGRKNNKFVVMDGTGKLVDVTRPHKAPVVRPTSGDAALIDPRRENPLDFLMLDLRDTFEFTPIADAGTQDYERASYTIEVLGLNDRDYLVRARRTAFRNYRALLSAYGPERNPQRRCAGMRAIRDNNHPTVWWEMKRQRQRWEEPGKSVRPRTGISGAVTAPPPAEKERSSTRRFPPCASPTPRGSRTTPRLTSTAGGCTSASRSATRKSRIQGRVAG